ncbi:DUF6884 domain-containing protein [Mastigocladopsis repens]|uniref:DUF6884 domain-containing protein n=1 Tax=Mastigocladopsis repens TaxID=221287 RepID=UPI0002ED3C39|nr:DUF6884 domain-containing protein [Mastigocladopsis repens]
MKLGFYAVLGKRDYLKLNNKKVGIWELTEYQPAGWLCSLFIKPEIIPQNCPIIHDCGAFGYREQDYPTINSQYVDAQWAANRYRERSCEGDTVVAPDNLLLGNINWRRQYNLEQAQIFIRIAQEKLPDRKPLATIHGLSIQEKIEYGIKLYQLGYKCLGIGGLAQQVASHIMETTNPNVEIIFLTGKLYRQQVIPILQAHNYTTRTPMEGLGIGQQIKWLLNQLSTPKQLSLKL